MKYKLTNTKVMNGMTLYQIQALKDFSNIKRGDLGGWIQSKKNLSQEGECWVFSNAHVYNNAKVYGNAWLGLIKVDFNLEGDFNRILRDLFQKDNLPILMGINPDLDKIISYKLSH